MKRSKNEKIRIEFKLVADQPSIGAMVIAALVVMMILTVVWLLIAYL